MAKDFSVYVNIGGRVAGSLSSAVKTVEGKLSGLTRHFQAQAAAQKAAIRGMMDSFKGAVALAAGGGLVFSLKKFLGDGEDLAHEMQALRNAGRTTTEIADGMREANKAIREMPTASLTNSMKILNETTGAFGDYKHAVENLAFNSKLGDVLANTIHVEDPAHALGSLIKALEIRGSASNPERYREEAGKLQQAMTFFGGRLTPDMIYAFASNAQQGVRQLNERFMTRIAPSMIQEMGGEKVGTGLTAFRTIISGRKISDMAQAKAWQDLGLLNKKDIITNKKTGEIKGWRDGAVKGTDLAYKDPLQYMEDVILPRLRDHGIGGKKVDITDPIKLGAALTTLFKNTKANAFVTAISTVVDRTRLKKDEDLINKVLDTDKNYDESILNDPKLARFAIVQAMKNMGAALSLPVMKPLAQMLISIARAVNQFSAALMEHPELARVVAGIGTALATWAALRLASFALGITGLARALAFLALAAPLGMAARLIAVAKGITAISIAATMGLARRLALSAGALMMLGRVGGVSAVLGAVGGSIGRFAKAVLLFPVTALRAIAVAMWGLVANPVGLVITAAVVALTALGIWVANNWSGLKTFFSEFGSSFMKGLGPGPAHAVSSIVGALQSVWDWINKILGPLDSTGEKWAAWGRKAGEAAAIVINTLADLPRQIAALLTNFDWSAIGSAIGGKLKAGIGAIGGWIGSKFGLGGGDAPAPAGTRAMGGPVTKGLSYLVGERGPELFTPGTSGSIMTAGKTAGLLGGGGPSVDASAVTRTAAIAAETGGVLHAALDATRKPVVDTSSLDEATEKASKLSMILASIGSGNINLGDGAGGGVGGGGGPGGVRGAWNGKTMPIAPGSGIGHVASQAERAAFTQEVAKSLGMDPKTALRVSQSEGFYKYLGDHGRSFGEWQLFTGGGLGNIAMKRGINIRDPKTWKEQTRFALEWAKKHGWGDWHGAARVGISRMQGINARAMGGPVAAGMPYLVGERGPELFTPGASGGISTAAATRILREGDGSFVPSPEAVAKHRSTKVVSNVRGDTHYSPSFVIHESSVPEKTKREVENHFWDLVRQAESDQRGLLSD